MAQNACCTCASLLSTISPLYDIKTEKLLEADRNLPCCARIICGRCIIRNPRFATYCPFCQLSTEPNPLQEKPLEASSEPPPYTPSQQPRGNHPPPEYSEFPLLSTSTTQESSSATTQLASQPIQDVTHFLAPTDTLTSISLAYGVPIPVLRSTNNLFADHLLAARKKLTIPASHYKGGVSLSPKPVISEEEEIRKGKIRRFMVGCKVPEYDIALLYLKQTSYDLDGAIEAYRADEQWEKDHPMNSYMKGKGRMASTSRRKIGGIGITGQLG